MPAYPMLLAAQLPTRTTWQRVSVPLLTAGGGWEQTEMQEPNVLYDGSTWKMWYTGDWNTSAMGYATCSGDPTVTANWTKSGSNPVLCQGGSSVAGYGSGFNVCKIGSTFYAYYYDASGGGNLKVSTSSDGIAWNTPTTAIASNAKAWITGWANTFVWNEGGSTWKMLVEGRSTAGGTPWVTNYATSTDGLSWTVQGAGPLTSLAVTGQDNYGGPWLANGGATVNGRYELWYHCGSGNFTDIYHAWSTDAQTWTQTGVELRANLGAYEKQQVADPSIVEQGGKTYLFYDGVDNLGPTSYINVAVLPMTVAEYCRWIG